MLRMRASTSHHLAAGQPPEQVDPVDALVDEGAARHLRRVDEPPGRARLVPVLGDRPAARLVQHGEVADLAGVEPRLECLMAQPHQPLERHAHDAGRLDHRDHLVGLRHRHRHRLAHHDVLAGARRPHRQIGDVADRRGDVDDVDVVAADDRVVVGDAFDAERARSRRRALWRSGSAATTRLGARDTRAAHARARRRNTSGRGRERPRGRSWAWIGSRESGVGNRDRVRMRPSSQVDGRCVDRDVSRAEALTRGTARRARSRSRSPSATCAGRP